MRYVLFRRKPEAREVEVSFLEAMEGLRILERTGDRAFLVDLTTEALKAVQAKLPGWSIAPETVHREPEEPRPRPRDPDSRPPG